MLTRAAHDLLTTDSIKSREDCYSISECFDSLPLEVKNRINRSFEYNEFWENATRYLLDNEFETENGNLEAIEKLASDKGIDTEFIHNYFIDKVENKILEFLEDGLITAEEEKELSKMIYKCKLSADDFVGNDNYDKYLQSLILSDLKDGKEISTKIETSHLPILMGKTEYAIWCYQNVAAYEEKTGKRYEGGSRGVSIRLCKGVYYRVGASKGHSVDYSYINPVGKGVLLITNKNIIFHGDKTIKLPINKIITFSTYSDGIELQKDGVRAKPVTFTGFDPWFISNLLPQLKD